MIRNDSSVNYIRHLSEALEKITFDDRLNTSHVSMYVALFQMWNISRFTNPFLIIRSEIMQISKVQSKSTYHRCIRELDSLGYIEYLPSKNASTGSKIKMISFSNPKIRCTKNELPNGQPSAKNGHQNQKHSPKNGLPMGLPRPKYGLPIEPFNKHINNNKHINLFMSQNEFCEPTKVQKIENDFSSSKKINKPNFIPPSLEFVQEYFHEKKKPDIEAQKFFNYFESKGWKIGDRSPMKNWKAAANNWILNFEKYNPSFQQLKPDNLHVNTDKDYSIPL